MPRVQTPWGWSEVLLQGRLWLFKQLWIKPGARTSLQRHQWRVEWWYPIEGSGTIIIGNEMIPTSDCGRWLYICACHIHRLAASNTEGLLVLELQLGHSRPPSEDDIYRLEDDFGRAN